MTTPRSARGLLNAQNNFRSQLQQKEEIEIEVDASTDKNAEYYDEEEDEAPSTNANTNTNQNWESQHGLIDNKKKQIWNFFENQELNCYSIDFVDKEFHADDWKNLLSRQLALLEGKAEVQKKVVDIEMTYEPNILSAELADWIETEREMYNEKYKENNEYSVFDIIHEKQLEQFSKLFPREIDEDGIEINKYSEITFNAFESFPGSKSRNTFEIFSHKNNYFIVGKSYDFDQQNPINSGLVLKIFKYEPSRDDEKGSCYQCFKTVMNVGSINDDENFDPELISVIQYKDCLYYMKTVEDEFEEDCDVVFEMRRFSLESEEDSLVKRFLYNSNRESKETKVFAYSAIFIKIEDKLFENEEEFVNMRIVAVILKGEEPDTFNFELRRFNNFEQTIFYCETPIQQSKIFKFQFFRENSILKRQAFTFINNKMILVVPIGLNDSSETTYKEFYHFPEKHCTCCTEKKKEIAVNLRNEYLKTSKVLESFNITGEEEYKQHNFLQEEMAVKLLTYIMKERDKTVEISLTTDDLYLMLDKRTKRYVLFINCYGRSENSRNEISIFESILDPHIRHAKRYNPSDLSMFVRYAYEERPKFLEKHQATNISTLIQKQMYELFDNCIVESKKDDDGNQQTIVAWEWNDYGELDEANQPTRRLYISFDDSELFSNTFRGIDQNAQVQFIQLGHDDRLILPRVVFDKAKKQFIFQMYQYQKEVYRPVPEEKQHLNTDDDDIDLYKDNEAKKENERILFQLPIDLSTANLNFQKTQTFITPSSSVYLEKFGQANNHFVQNFQVVVYEKNCQLVRIFVYRCYWNPNKGKDKYLKPYLVSAKLVGIRLLAVKPSDKLEPSGFFSLYDDKMKIIGTQFILNKSMVYNMPNYERDEWIFAGDIAMSGYKFYYDIENLDEEGLLLVVNLSEVLLARDEFTESDHSMILKMQMRLIWNMVPYFMDQFLVKNCNPANFLQPIELMKSVSLLAFVLDDSAVISDILKQMVTTQSAMTSVFEWFVKELSAKEREELMAEDYYIPSLVEVSRDISCYNPLIRCFDSNPIRVASLEKILVYMFTRPFSKNQSMIFMEIMPMMLNQDQPSYEFSKFFIDSPSHFINFDKIGSRLTVMCDNPDLPTFSSYNYQIVEFNDILSLRTQTDVKRWMEDSLMKQESMDGVSASVAVRHYYIDFRVTLLGKKLDYYRKGKEVPDDDVKDYDVAKYLSRICTVYGKDIEFQDSTRNLIDEMYEASIFTNALISVFFFFGFLVPCLLQVFVFESPHLVFASQCLCIFSLSIYFIFMCVQVYYQGKSYFSLTNNLIDIFLVIIYIIYFSVLYWDNRAYLPEYVIKDGDIDTGRRLARGRGGGGSSAGGARGPISGSVYSNQGDGGSFSSSTNTFNLWGAEYSARTVDKITFLVFVHMSLLASCSLKFINMISILKQFQRLLLILKYCILKMLPFLFLIYFWVLISSLMFRILGGYVWMDNPDTEYPFFGPLWIHWMNTYKLGFAELGLNIYYQLWEDLYDNFQLQSRLLGVFIWIWWLINNFAMLIFGLNFSVSVITQSYEEALYKFQLESYRFKVEKVLVATALTKLFDISRTMTTFSISFQDNSEVNWNGVVKTIKAFIREENISLKKGVYQKMKNLEQFLGKKTEDCEEQVKQLQQNLNYFSQSIQGKLDFMAQQLVLITSNTQRRDSVMSPEKLK